MMTTTETTSADLISALIQTYRTLNHEIRPRDERELRSRGSGGHAVRDVVEQMRDDEMRFSQALKERISGVPMPDWLQNELPVIGTESEGDSTAVLIAQFGTARESTLAMLRTLDAADWDAELDEGQPIRQRIVELVENDQRHLQRLGAIRPAAATAAT